MKAFLEQLVCKLGIIVTQTLDRRVDFQERRLNYKFYSAMDKTGHNNKYVHLFSKCQTSSDGVNQTLQVSIYCYVSHEF